MGEGVKEQKASVQTTPATDSPSEAAARAWLHRCGIEAAEWPWDGEVALPSPPPSHQRP